MDAREFLNSVGDVVVRRGRGGVEVEVLEVGRLEIEIKDSGHTLNLDFIARDKYPEMFDEVEYRLNDLGLDLVQVGDYLDCGDDLYVIYDIRGLNFDTEPEELRNVLLFMEENLDSVY